MRSLYSISIRLYGIIIRFVGLFNKKASQFWRGRIEDKRNWQSFSSDDKVIWFHCASLGEFEQGRPVIEGFKEKYPSWKILLSFFSPSGYEIRKNYDIADQVVYLPLDTYKNAKDFLNVFRPNLAVFVKYEIWPNFLYELDKGGVPRLLISAIFRPEQIYFKDYGRFFLSALERFSQVFTQDKESQALLSKKSSVAVEIAGDSRFDRVIKLRKESFSHSLIESFTAGKKVIVVGSSWPADLRLLSDFIVAEKEKYRFIIAPHEIKQAEIDKWLSEINVRGSKLSELSEKGELDDDIDILIIDQIGILSKLYRYAHFAYIGGAFGDGLHNILEAATFGAPVFFGNKNYKKFREARELIAIDGAYAVGDLKELNEKIHYLEVLENYEEKKKQILEYIESQAGATTKIIDHIDSIIDEKTKDNSI